MTEREVPPPKAHRGSLATDDHVAGQAPRGEHQPTEGLDPSIDDEHLASPAQGARPEETPGDEPAGGGPGGEEETGSGPAFEG
ncbi:MAG TPA: hypothetical protein VFO05_11450 [Candidatus Limnocylindrales bacterium]|nr:hypothetical protein [Candidatus Limnocylindrales bacterium]